MMDVHDEHVRPRLGQQLVQLRAAAHLSSHVALRGLHQERVQSRAHGSVGCDDEEAEHGLTEGYQLLWLLPLSNELDDDPLLKELAEELLSIEPRPEEPLLLAELVAMAARRCSSSCSRR